MSRLDEETPLRARIPADVDRDDKIMFGLTGRQLAIASVVGLVLYGGYWATRTLVPIGVFAVAATPVLAVGFVLVIGRRDGIGLPQWLAAGWRHRTSARRLVPDAGPFPAPPGWVATTGPVGPLPAPLMLPATAVGPDGVLDLGPDGHVALLRAGTVNFALRSPAEQNALVAGFGRWLNSLDLRVQILVRAHRIDLTGFAERIAAHAAAVPDPRLEDLARSHAAFLNDLCRDRTLLHRHVILAVRDRRSAAHARQRAVETCRGLSAILVAAAVCDETAVRQVLAEGLDPTGSAPPSGLAPPDAVIRATPPTTRREYR